MQEQEPTEETQRAPVPLGTKIGLIALPMLPAIVIDMIAHGGITPPALTAFGLSYLAFDQSPKMLARLGENKAFLAYLGTHPEALRKFDKLTNGYLGKQIGAQHTTVADPHREDASSARLTELATMPYQDYLQTPEWDERRRHIRERDNNRCQDCGSTMRLDVHHLTYERRGNEHDADLVTLCHACHAERHGIVEDTPMEELQPRASQGTPTLNRSLRTPSDKGAFFMFSDILRKGFVPSLDRIYLATLEDGTDVYVTAAQLCHVALAGATRGGKGHIKRLLMAQLAYAGAELYLLDPNYTRWDRESRDPSGKRCPEDWTPFDRFLQNDPTELIPVKQKYRVIGEYLRAADEELDGRLELYGNSRPVGRPIFLFLDELPDIVENIPNVQVILKKLLRQGAKVGVNVVCLSQDFLVETLFPKSGGGAVRDCYRTVLYVGGDATTARVLLDMAAKDVPENELGKGRAMVRCDVVRPAAKAREPYVDNPALYTLLGPSTYVEQEDEDETRAGAQLMPALRYESQIEPETEKLPATHRVASSSFDAYQARKTKHRVAVMPRVQGTPARVQSDPESGLTQDERAVLVAYRSGLKTGNAIAGEVQGISSTRANQILNKLSRQGLIDWQPRKA